MLAQTRLTLLAVSTWDAVADSRHQEWGEANVSEQLADLESARAQVAAWQARMEEIRAATQVEVLDAWTTPWRNDETVKVKVSARLASNQEFREIMVKAREAKAQWGLDS